MSIQPDMIGLTVRDMEVSLAFYRLLGLAVPPAAGEDHVELITPNGYRLAWDTVALAKSLYPDWVEPVGQRVTLAFKCDSPAEVDATYARLTAAGYAARREPWDAFWGQRYAVVVDPDGNAVDVFAALG
jgi:catechol 2,3-dioxygenase-like lactoylglutathione lyase family enzyme